MTARISLLAFLFIAACAQAPSGGSDPAAPARPNIVLILADDLGWSDLGSYGGEIATPHLDALAAGGLRFTNFHSAAKCFPSRAALLTGLYPQQVGMAERAKAAMTAGVTVAERLGASGYRTYMVGKHHGTDHPMEFGFDRYWGLRDGASNHFNPGARRPGEPAPAQKRPGGRVWCDGLECTTSFNPDDPDFYTTDAYTDRALAFLADHESEAPFFLYLSYQAPHDPLQAWPADIANYEGRYGEGYAAVAQARRARQEEAGLIDARFPEATPTHRDWSALSPEERADQERRMAVYAAMIDRLDQNVGRLIAALRARGALNDTLILFMSDNGASAELVLRDGREIGHEHPVGAAARWASLGADWANVSNTPFRYWKNSSYAGGTASPLIAYWPEGIAEPGRFVGDLSHFIDIAPTLAALAGASDAPSLGDDRQPPLEGVDISGAFRGAAVARAAPLFHRWAYGGGNGRYAHDGRWKLVAYNHTDGAETPWALYDTSRDRTETVDVADAHPDVVERLSNLYEAWWARVGAAPEPGSP
ncbi:MAG: sulfatase-like hydrolase/transferase [Caulobacterales bacterium]|nr:sulfatase-like hydrolase/transferase [Caulobacterales bacterium]